MVERDEGGWGDETIRNDSDEERATVEERPRQGNSDVATGEAPSAPPKRAATPDDPWQGDTERAPFPPHFVDDSLEAGLRAATIEDRSQTADRRPRPVAPEAARAPALPRLVDRVDEAPVAATPGATPLGTLGGYQLRKRLAVGGMGEVFLAELVREGGFRKTVVIKRMLPQLDLDGRFVEMFLREGRIAARLNHPNVVQVFELGRDGRGYFLVMEFVDGITLANLATENWRRGRPLPMELLLRAVADAAAGLHSAHELRGPDGEASHLVHRDVSPDNLMISRDGVTKVLDFGIARAPAEALTNPGEVKGKLQFLAPEQLDGHDIDRRVDIHALGATLYYLLTGRSPFKGDTAGAVLEAIHKRPPPRPSSVNPRIPPILDDLVCRCLAKDPAERPQTAAEVADALQRMLPSSRAAVAPLVAELMDTTAAEAKASPFVPRPGFIAADGFPNLQERARAGVSQVPELGPPQPSTDSAATYDVHAVSTVESDSTVTSGSRPAFSGDPLLPVAASQDAHTAADASTVEPTRSSEPQRPRSAVAVPRRRASRVLVVMAALAVVVLLSTTALLVARFG